jgi:putative membrane protein
MKRIESMTMLLVFTFLSLGISVFAQSTPKGDTSLSPADKHFMNEAAEGGQAEVELGQLATSKASDQKVKDFGQKMVDDHSKANDHLKDCASKLGITLPHHPSAMEEAQKAKLSAYSGAHFDKAYMDGMVKDHRADIAAFKKEADEGQNAEIKQFATNTLPTLEEHLRLAEQADREVNGASAGSSTSGGATR